MARERGLGGKTRVSLDRDDLEHILGLLELELEQVVSDEADLRAQGDPKGDLAMYEGSAQEIRSLVARLEEARAKL